MVAALAGELAVTRERLDTVERLAQAAGLFGPPEVEAFAADNEQAQARDAIRQGIIAHVFAPLKTDTETGR
jgi:AmiR/NasT family two-component response regulator